MWALIVSVPAHCLSFYFTYHMDNKTALHSWNSSKPMAENSKLLAFIMFQRVD